MNNKGFAVSTILYGLSIMGFLIVLVLIGIMASNRSNTKDFVMQVEDELNRFSSKQTEIVSNGNTNYPQEFFTLDGTTSYWYKIELWNGKKYISSTFKVSSNTIIFFYIGNGTDDVPTIACLDGDSRDNCKQGGNKLIMSTATGINNKTSVSQGSDAETGDSARRVYLIGSTQNEYSFNNVQEDYKVRVSLSSMDTDPTYLNAPDQYIAGVFYIKGSGDNFYYCDSSCNIHQSKFTGDQNQQWTIINNQKTNAKYKTCTSNGIPGATYNALF